MKSQFIGKRPGLFNELRAKLYPYHFSLLFSFEEKIIKNETKVRFTCTVINKHSALFFSGRVPEQGFDELVEMIDLLQLSSGVLIELAVARENVELF